MIALLGLGLAACVKRVPPPKGPAHRAYRLLQKTPEVETALRNQKRADLQIDTRTQLRTPRVVAEGESPLISLNGAHAILSGDAGGTTGWSVDNFVLFEVSDANGKVVSRFVVGFAEPVTRNHQRLDNVGPMHFTFGPKEIDITSHLPHHQPFRIHATALDYGGVGHVSDLYLLLDRTGQPSIGDLRDQ